jgi:DNA-binding IclR family transcriptional regulator
MSTLVVKSAGRVFQILELFQQQKRPLSVREIAEHFGYPLVSASLLVKSIATLGYLTYDRQARTYFPTMRVLMLGEWLQQSVFIGDRIVPLVHAIAQQTGETAMVAAQNDIYSQYLYVVPSRYPLQFYPQVGALRPLCWSGTGFALLSQLPDESVRKMYQRSRMRLPKSEFPIAMTLESVLEHVRLARRRGYALTRNMTTPGSAVVAVPLPVSASGARLVIGVAGLASRFDTSARSVIKTMNACLRRYQKGYKAGSRAA